MTPCLSIIMPTYNGAKYLAEQLDSIREQTFQDFELLIVDDGSSDGTAALTAAYAVKDSRIRILPSTGNIGQNSRLIELVKASAGELVAISDQDDIWQADKLALLIAALGPASLACGTSWLIDGDGTHLNRTLCDGMYPPPGDGDRLTYLFRNTFSGHGIVVRRDKISLTAFQRYHWFDQLIGIDSVFSDGVRWVPEAVTFHRLHSGNQMNGEALRPPLSKWQVISARNLGSLARSHNYRKWLLLQRFEHLASSECIPPATAATFKKLTKLCAEAWFDPREPTPMSDTALRNAMIEALSPMRGSQADWNYVKYLIQDCTRSVTHPRTLYRMGRGLITSMRH